MEFDGAMSWAEYQLPDFEAVSGSYDDPDEELP
jgi:hypothetical protein